MIVAEASYNSSDPTVDSQVIALKASGADVFFLATSPKFAAQALRKAFELDWKADRILVSAASQIPTVLKPAGVEASKGVISSQSLSTRATRCGRAIPPMKEFYSFMEKWVPGVQPDEASATYIYSAAQMIRRYSNVAATIDERKRDKAGDPHPGHSAAAFHSRRKNQY